MKILFIADQHYMLRKKGVKREWLANRLTEFHEQIKVILEGIDLVILGGDLFDKAPSIGEVGFFLDFLELCKRYESPVVMIAGNHEATTKYETFLSEIDVLQDKYFTLVTGQKRIKYKDMYVTYMSYGEVKRQTNPKLPIPDWKNIMVSHVCGDLPPHVKEEYPISNFDGYDLTLLGDLHHYHRSLTGKNSWYPGSPYSISFSQASETNKYGVFVIDTESTTWTTPEFIPLDLPQLITIKCSPEEIDEVKLKIQDSRHCYKIEVEGTPEEMAKITDKSVIKKSVVSSTATVDLRYKTREEELDAVLDYMGIESKVGVMSLYANIRT